MRRSQRRIKVKREYRSRRKGSIFRTKFFWRLIFLLAIFFGSFYLIGFFPKVQIENIKVSGNQKVIAQNIENLIREEVKRKFLFFASNSILLADLDRASEAILEEFIQIGKADLKKNFPNTIEVVVAERESAVIFCQRMFEFLPREDDAEEGEILQEEIKECFFADKEGVIFEYLTSNVPEGAREFVVGDYPILVIENLTLAKNLKLGEIVIEEEKLSYVLKVEQKLEEALKTPLIGATIVSSERLDMKTKEGWDIYINLTEDLDWQLTKMMLVLSKEISEEKRADLQYIDLRFTKVYYK